MSKPILFLKKNKADYTNSQVIATASEGSLYAPYALARSNLKGWMTTGSVDANNTTFTVNLVDARTVTDILLVTHNFKSFTIKYWNGSAWADFSSPINPTNCTDSVSRFTFASVSTTQIQITILGTQIPNSDKFLFQFICTEQIGQLMGWPLIKKPTFDKNKRISKMLSGKSNIGENVGGFSCDLNVQIWNSDADMSIVEKLYSSNEGFLVWLCGGDEAQFSSLRQGYRKQDVFLMKCLNNYIPEFYQGLYTSGITITVSLAEVTT